MTTIAQLSAALAGRYEIERELGRGGMATVYLAHDRKHERLVALKVLDPELGAVLGAERFLSEIRVTANLQHPNLLRLGADQMHFDPVPLAIVDRPMPELRSVEIAAEFAVDAV